MNAVPDLRYDNEMAGLGDRPLFFLHIPKTAGTSFRDLLGRRFSPESTMTGGMDDAKGVTRNLLSVGQYRFINGHFPYEAVKMFTKRPFIFTVLREPVDRAISAFYFMKQQSASIEQRAAAGRISKERASDHAKARAMTLVDFVHNEPLAAARHMGNLQVELLTCTDLEKRHRYDEHYNIDVSQKELELAMERLSTFDAIGLMERLPESKEYLAYALQTRPFDELGWSNQTLSRPLVGEIDPETMAILLDLTFYDRKLYAFAAELFECRRRAMLHRLLALHAGRTDPAFEIRLSSSFTAGAPVPGEGWYAPERNEDRWFNWTGPASDSWIELGTPAGTNFMLRVHILHALYSESLFELEVSVNGVKLKHDVREDAVGHIISAPLSANLLREEGRSNKIVLRVPQPLRPCDSDPMNNDSRILGVAVHRIEICSMESLVVGESLL